MFHCTSVKHCFFTHTFSIWQTLLMAYWHVNFYRNNLLCSPGRTMCMCSPSRKTDNVNALVVPSRRMWMINLPWFKNPISIINKIGGGAIWRQNLALYEILTIKHVNDKLAIGWSTCRCQDFKHMHVAELRVPGKTMCAFTLFCWAPDEL